ncbi:hypothetical protein LCGC14_0556660 [marine sediment metagenome]|uniref:Uncharacterized protein n=1 Tax=marine sediment metagenome TaxID=412755 RepID=A0A0F9UWJ8_9ZZZZ
MTREGKYMDMVDVVPYKDECIYCKKIVWFWQKKSCEYIDEKGNPIRLSHLKCKEENEK